MLEPVMQDWDWLSALSGALDGSFVQAANEKVPEQERPEFDFFK